ncbi:MAG: 23S rRNA (guanosine(2251)-2'-O)-methyltransferase RlmB [SAR86 cluster bacterium]|uniref:23S rRNA (guanosine-2'-O-)-methyltransferase RlmB n=1 Tax=SAR86 cluster bacterium TaxID=2030880 RepID=A0A2A4XA86_9GAMM|nr:MAG: 23S rRNA (guanosine(2251)-2'-O)-methyltransferase RlmB [SAR86 cluster bacterium]
MKNKQDSQEKIIGIHAVSELLARRPSSVSRLLIQVGRNDKRINEIRELAAGANVAIEELGKEAFEREFEGVHQSVAAIAEFENSILSEKSLFELLKGLDHPPLLLILDGVTDPHNLGACLRSADAAGVDAVIIPKDKSVGLNATVRKVACGAAETVNLASVTNLARCLDKLKEEGVWLVGAADQADSSLYDQDLGGAIALIMGSEGSGLRRLTRESCDFLVSIPMAGALSSLNVSVATGVCLYEARRQRISSNS